MGPKTTSKVIEKVIPKDDAQIIYIKFIGSGSSEPSTPSLLSLQDIQVNIVCKGDILIDYIKRQILKVLHDLLNKDDIKDNEEIFKKLKLLQSQLTPKVVSELMLKEASAIGTEVLFKENLLKMGNGFLTPLSTYHLGIVTENKSTVLMKV